MKIFSSHRKKLAASRRFGGREFRDKVKSAAGYKRAFRLIDSGFKARRFWALTGSKMSRTLALFLVLIIAYFFVFSSRLTISEIEISGNNQVSSQQIKDLISLTGNSRVFLIRKNNFLLMSRGNVNKILTSGIPTIKEVVKADRTWPNKINLEVRERTPGFVIESSGKYFLVDDEGTVVSVLADPGKFLVVLDQLTESFELAEILSNQKLAPFILSMSRQWGSKISTPLVSIKFPGKSSNEAQFVTAQGWGVMFDTSRPVASQLSDLAVLLNRQIPTIYQPRLAYIDLRLGSRAYYCFKESPCQQKPLEAGTSTEIKKP